MMQTNHQDEHMQVNVEKYESLENADCGDKVKSNENIWETNT